MNGAGIRLGMQVLGAKRSHYQVLAMGKRPGFAQTMLWITDLNGPKSITNDAEQVVAELTSSFGKDKRIIYRDTQGEWWELIHRNGEFAGYQPVPGLGFNDP